MSKRRKKAKPGRLARPEAASAAPEADSEELDAFQSPDYDAYPGFFVSRDSLEGIQVNPAPSVEDPAAILRRLGPPPPWTIPAQLRAILEPAYQAASAAARSLNGRRREG
jgi:hypothetical protein